MALPLVTGIALKDRLDLISIWPLSGGCKKLQTLYSHWIKHDLGRPNDECDDARFQLNTYISFSSLSVYILGKIVLDLVLKRVDTICRF